MHHIPTNESTPEESFSRQIGFFSQRFNKFALIIGILGVLPTPFMYIHYRIVGSLSETLARGHGDRWLKQAELRRHSKVFCSFLFLSMVLGRLVTFVLPGTFASRVIFSVSQIIAGITYFLFWCLVFTHPLSLVPSNKWKSGVFVFACLLASILSAVSFNIQQTLVTTQLSLPRNFFPVDTSQLQSRKFVVISDLHITGDFWMGADKVEELAQRIRSLDADYLLILGDIVDIAHSNVVFKTTGLRLSQLSNVTKHGTYAVIGNHDLYSGVDVVVSELRRAGIKVLNSEIKHFDGFQLIGFTDHGMSATQKQIEEAEILLRNYDRSLFPIVMVHQPNKRAIRKISEMTRETGALTLCGHTHNAQLFPLGWLMKLNYPYIYGKHVFDKNVLYISSGVGTTVCPFRLGSEPEVVLIQF
ncbi:hypothetical protein RCL1_002680 [Eukaryota sp. TZLM3-RCL]